MQNNEEMVKLLGTWVKKSIADKFLQEAKDKDWSKSHLMAKILEERYNKIEK